MTSNLQKPDLSKAPPPAETNPNWEAFNGRSPMPGPAEIGGTVGHLAASYELTKQIGRMTHSGDEDWLDDADDNRATIDGLIAKARDIMAMPSTAQGGGGTVEEIEKAREAFISDVLLNDRFEQFNFDAQDAEDLFDKAEALLSRLSAGGAGREVVAPEGYVLVPIDPPEALLISMAIREDHGLGCPGYYDQAIFGGEGVGHQRRLESAITTMRQLYEEVVGKGFYKPDNAERYTSLRASAAGGA